MGLFFDDTDLGGIRAEELVTNAKDHREFFLSSQTLGVGGFTLGELTKELDNVQAYAYRLRMAGSGVFVYLPGSFTDAEVEAELRKVRDFLAQRHAEQNREKP